MPAFRSPKECLRLYRSGQLHVQPFEPGVDPVKSVLTAFKRGGNRCAVAMRISLDDVLYTVDGTSVMRTSIPVTAAANRDDSERATCGATRVVKSPKGLDIEILPLGAAVHCVKHLTVQTYADSEETFAYFDLVLRDHFGNTIVTYSETKHDKVKARHSGDIRRSNGVLHEAELTANDANRTGVCYVWQVHGYQKKPLVNFKDHQNCVVATFADNTKACYTVPWDMSKAMLDPDVIVANWLAVICQPDGTFTLLNVFSPMEYSEETWFDTGSETGPCATFCGVYARAAQQVLGAAKQHTALPIEDTPGRDDGTIVPTTTPSKHSHIMVVCNADADMCAPPNVLTMLGPEATDPIRLHPGTFGLCKPGRDNMRIPPVTALCDPNLLHIVYVPCNHTFEGKELVRCKGRCFVIVDQCDYGSDANAIQKCNFYAAAVCSPDSTIVVCTGPDRCIPVYGWLPADCERHRHTSSMSTSTLYRTVLEAHSRDRNPPENDPDALFARFAACLEANALISADWDNTAMNALHAVILGVPADQWPTWRARVALLLETSKRTMTRAAIAGCTQEAADAAKKVKRLHQRFASAMFAVHPCKAISIEVAHKLSSNAQAVMRRHAGKQLLQQIIDGKLKDADGLIACIGDIDYAFVVNKITREWEPGLFDEYAVSACCKKGSLDMELPNKAGIFVPILLFDTGFLNELNPSMAFNNGCNDELHSYLLWLSKSLTPSAPPNSDASFRRLTVFLTDVFDTLTETFSAGYKPSSGDTTGQLLATLRCLVFLVCACPTQQNPGGFYNPHILRYYRGVGSNIVPEKRVNISTLPRRLVDWAVTSCGYLPGNLLQRVRRVYFGDVFKAMFTSFIAPWLQALKRSQKGAQSKTQTTLYDRAQRTKQYQLCLLLKLVCPEFCLREACLSIGHSYYDLRQTPGLVSGRRKSSNSTAFLERMLDTGTITPQYEQIVGARFAPWFGKAAAHKLSEGSHAENFKLAKECVLALVLLPNPLRDIESKLGLSPIKHVSTVCQPFSVAQLSCVSFEVKPLQSYGSFVGFVPELNNTALQDLPQADEVPKFPKSTVFVFIGPSTPGTPSSPIIPEIKAIGRPANKDDTDSQIEQWPLHEVPSSYIDDAPAYAHMIYLSQSSSCVICSDRGKQRVGVVPIWAKRDGENFEDIDIKRLQAQVACLFADMHDLYRYDRAHSLRSVPPILSRELISVSALDLQRQFGNDKALFVSGIVLKRVLLALAAHWGNCDEGIKAGLQLIDA